MTPKMRKALTMMREHGIYHVGDSHVCGVVTSAATHLSSGQPWIHWRTAYALRDAGLATIEGHGEETELWVSREPS